MEENTTVEIHDSVVELIECKGDGLVVVLDAYVHRSQGRPGIDDGTGWSQELRLNVRNGKVEGDVERIPMELLDGHLVLSSKSFENFIPVPLDHSGPVRIEFRGWNDWQVAIVGEGIAARLVGSGVYIEEFTAGRDSEG